MPFAHAHPVCRHGRVRSSVSLPPKMPSHTRSVRNMQTQACDRCHRRKTRCDRRFPRCGACESWPLRPCLVQSQAVRLTRHIRSEYTMCPNGQTQHASIPAGVYQFSRGQSAPGHNGKTAAGRRAERVAGIASHPFSQEYEPADSPR